MTKPEKKSAKKTTKKTNAKPTKAKRPDVNESAFGLLRSIAARTERDS